MRFVRRQKLLHLLLGHIRIEAADENLALLRATVGGTRHWGRWVTACVSACGGAETEQKMKQSRGDAAWDSPMTPEMSRDGTPQNCGRISISAFAFCAFAHSSSLTHTANSQITKQTRVFAYRWTRSLGVYREPECVSLCQRSSEIWPSSRTP